MSQLKIRDLHPAIGAEVEGLVPSIPLDDETIAELRRAFDDRGVLLFRDLDIDEDFQRYLVFTLIGEEPPADRQERLHRDGPMLISNKEEGGAAPYGRLLFHCDTMWAENPQPVISLYGVKVEQPTAPTMFVNMAEAFDRMPEDLRRRVDGLRARHGQVDGGYPNRGGDEDVIDTYYDADRTIVTPIVNTHPRTGHPLLYVSQQCTIDIEGLSKEENEELLEELFQCLYDDGSLLAHEWREHDLVVWDNVTAQHARGIVALEGPERTLRKVFGPMRLTDAERGQLPHFSKVESKS